MLRDRKNAPADATQTALLALSFILADDAYRDRFVALSGVAPQSLADSIHDTAFLAGVLDYLMQDEAILLAFCDEHELAPEAVARASYTLSPVEFDG